jgi:signal transduction histidine kinase
MTEAERSGESVPGEQSILLSALPPTKEQNRLAVIIALVLLIAFFITLPFMRVQLPTVNAFIPIVDTILFLNDLITAALLYAQFSVVRSRAMLALAMGYLFNAAIIVPHALTFPDAFTPTGLLGAGLQTTVWLYIFWHLGLPPAVIAYVLLKREQPETTAVRGAARSTIVTSAAAVILLACVLTWLVTAGARVMPSIMVDAMHASDVWHYFAAPPILVLSVASIALLWWRRLSMLDLWLLVVLWAWLIETVLLSTTAYRFSLVWYAGRIYGLLSSSFVLLVLLSESTMLYARLALSVLAQRREREGRLMTLDAMSAAIAHEIKQPLGAMVANANAGQRWLTKTPPSLDEALDTFKDIAADGHRASEVIQSVRAMFSKGEQAGTLVSTNELIRETIEIVHGELEVARVAVQFQLAPQLPLISAHRGQLQQVILNIIINAIDAMRTIADRARLLLVKSEAVESDRVAVSVEDSGTGIDPKNIDRIFDAFFTTKTSGMGMGLAICRSIVEAHGGTLSVSSGARNGSVFRLVLPTNR